jgi:hypothetical protein
MTTDEEQSTHKSEADEDRSTSIDDSISSYSDSDYDTDIHMSENETNAWRFMIEHCGLENKNLVEESVSELWKNNEKLLKTIKHLSNYVEQLCKHIQSIKRGDLYFSICKNRRKLVQNKGYSFYEANLSSWEERKILVASLLEKNKKLLYDLCHHHQDSSESSNDEQMINSSTPNPPLYFQ